MFGAVVRKLIAAGSAGTGPAGGDLPDSLLAAACEFDWFPDFSSYRPA